MLSMSAQKSHVGAPGNAKQPQKVSEAPMGDNQVLDMAQPDGLHGSHTSLTDSSGTSSSEPPGSATYPTKAAREALLGVGQEQVKSTWGWYICFLVLWGIPAIHWHDKVFLSPLATLLHLVLQLHCSAATVFIPLALHQALLQHASPLHNK